VVAVNLAVDVEASAPIVLIKTPLVPPQPSARH